jgi:hypothetical protein
MATLGAKAASAVVPLAAHIEPCSKYTSKYTGGCCSCGKATASAMRVVAIVDGKAALSFSQPSVRSRPCASAPLPVQAKCCLPGLLRRDLLGPRAHECRGPRVARVALERIAPEKGPSATDTDRLLGDRDDRALHGNVRRPGALDRLQRRDRPGPPRLPGSRARGRIR